VSSITNKCNAHLFCSSGSPSILAPDAKSALLTVLLVVLLVLSFDSPLLMASVRVSLLRSNSNVSENLEQKKLCLVRILSEEFICLVPRGNSNTLDRSGYRAVGSQV
jgi:hypothetical protein